MEKTYTEQQQYKLIERLQPFYEKRIEASIDWSKVQSDFEDPDGQIPSEDGDGVTQTSMLGTAFSVMPSGKYWTLWACANTTQKERIKDTAFSEALNKVAEKHGHWIEFGINGDLCDMFICNFKSNES